MANISLDQIAGRVLQSCLAGGPWQPEDIDALSDSDSDALFRIVAEGLADRFDPRLTEAYVDIFSYAIARIDKRFQAAELRSRYQHIRRVLPYKPWTDPRQRILEVEEKALRRLRTGGAAYRVPGIRPPQEEDEVAPRRIVVLSRVTLGADIAVTSVVTQALQTRFPESELMLAGSSKSAELLGLPLLEIDYPRSGGLRERLRSMDPIAALGDDVLIVDPDSRLTQLGVYPVAPDYRSYYFFDSRSVEDAGSLSDLARDWCARVFEVDIPSPRIIVSKPRLDYARPAITVSLGVGGNDGKRIGGSFERDLLTELSRRAATVILDKGAGEEEASRAEAAAAGLSNVRFWDGSFAGFASLIANSDLYVGYDSVGQHAAAALRVPLVSIFAGAVNDRFFERWRPDGRVLRIDGGSPESVFIRVRSALPDKLRANSPALR